MFERRRPTRFWLAAAMLLAGAGFSCAFGDFRPGDPMGHQFNLEKSQKAYTDAVRWSKFDEAASYLDPGEREAFLAQMPDFDDGRFTDWEAGVWQFDDPEEMIGGVIHVTYRAYSMNTLLEFKVKERQQWSRPDDGKLWKVESEFSGLGQFAGE
ncbi:MAG: hypothetical protein NZ990_02895 [Myxococcota bacterium]|nr:hypothetical protein [Myxococcota bacterium]